MTFAPDSIIAVVGAGAMGSGIAQVAAQAGHNVILIDANADALERSRGGIAANLDRLLKREKITREERADIEKCIRWTVDFDEVAPARLVIEAIIENKDAKLGLFARLAEIIAPDAVIASNTSSLSINDMAGEVAGPQRFAGLHFFNPVPVMKLVEVVPDSQTDEAVARDLLALMKSWGKVGVKVRDVPGFIVNRVARPYYAEGFAALGEGINAAGVDRALEAAGGFRMGPLALADMIGHDVNYTVATSVYDAYEGKTRFRPQPSQQALFDSGALGRKSGKGVFDYGSEMPQASFVTPGIVPRSISLAQDHGAIEAIVAGARAAGLEISPDANLPANSLRIDDMVIALGDGRLLAQREDVDALLDHARDFGSAAAWVVTACDDRAASTAAAFAHLLGKQVVAIPDRAGQIVLRTLVQLANAAADAVADEVASVEDVDAAMRFGANHPEGPLAWARRTGLEQVGTMLNNIANATGDAMYRPAQIFQSTGAGAE